MYVVKPKPKSEVSPTYLVNFLSPKKPKPEVVKYEARANSQAQPTFKEKSGNPGS
jgi:hypothetical protein